jgi:hypothetical protein
MAVLLFLLAAVAVNALPHNEIVKALLDGQAESDHFTLTKFQWKDCGEKKRCSLC